MKEYVILIIVAGVIGSVVSLLSPEGEGGGISRHVRFAVGLVLIAVCLSPLVSFLDSLRELDLRGIFPEAETDEADKYGEIFQSSYRSAEVENLREGITVILADRFGIDPSEVTVSVRFSESGEDGESGIERIFITLYGSAIWKDTGEIESYLGDLLDCEIITAIG